MDSFTDTNGTTNRGRLRGDEATLFAEYHEPLIRSVARAVRTSRANIEDACSVAWMQLLTRQPDRREELFGWLHVVATREAVRFDRRSQRACAPLDCDEVQGISEVAPGDMRAALEQVAALPERQRQIFGLHIGGYSYGEIGDITGDTVRTVERHMMRARRTLRPLSRKPI